jgi:tetrahydromethanopterin S-methyltransferase subunit G
MKTDEVKKLLMKLDRVEKKVEEVAAPIYQERQEILNKLLPEFLRRKGKDVVGLLTSPLTLKFKDGQAWTLRPMYVDKAGKFRGAVFKNYGVPLFSITKKKGD